MKFEKIGRALVVAWLTIAPIGCGAGDEASIEDDGELLGSSAQAYEDSGFWIDDQRVIAQMASSTIEFGQDAGGRYISTSYGKRYANNGYRDLGYKVNYAGSGATQWVAFDFVGNNFFGQSILNQGRHMPIFLRAGSLSNAATQYNAEGKGIFLGANSGYGTCGAPDTKARIFFETRVMNYPVAIANQSAAGAAGVKCGDWFADKFFEDQVKYQLVMHANATHIAYWIYRYDAWGNATLWSANGTEALDYPPGTGINNELIAAKDTWLPGEYARMNTNNVSTFTMAMALIAMPNAPAGWTLKITNLASGRF